VGPLLAKKPHFQRLHVAATSRSPPGGRREIAIAETEMPGSWPSAKEYAARQPSRAHASPARSTDHPDLPS